MNDIEKLSPDIKKSLALQAKRESEISARKVVNAHRAAVQGVPLAELRQLDPLVPVNTLPDNGDGQNNLLPENQLSVGLTVTIAPWLDMTESSYKIKFAIDDEEFGDSGSVDVLADFAPFDHTIDVSAYKLMHGPHVLHWQAEGQQTGNSEDGPALGFFIDIYHPNLLEQPDAVRLPAGLPDGDITQEYLDQHGGVTFTLPTPNDPRLGDTFTFYIEGRAVIVDEDAVAPYEFEVLAAEFANFPEGMITLTYTLTDRAGNRSDDSLPVQVRLIKTPAPTLNPPIIAEGPVITLEDARDGVIVVHDYTSEMVDDFVVVTWQGYDMDAYYIPGSANVPIDIIRQQGGDEYVATVTYRVGRKGKVYESGPTNVTVDLTTIGPVNPGEPDPVNPNLVPLDLVSFTGLANQIVPADKGQPATITVQMYTPVNPDEIIEVFYANQSVEVTQLTQADIDAGEITVTLPWTTIDAAGNGVIDAFYRIYPQGKPENYQQAAITPIEVTVHNLENLTLAVFPDRHPTLNIINCNNEPWINGVNVALEYPTFEAGDEVVLNWVLDNTVVAPDHTTVPTDPLETTRKDFPHTISPMEAAAGRAVINVWWDTHISALTEGCIVVYWTLKRGEVSGISGPQFVRYSRIRPGSGRPVCPDDDLPAA